MKKPKVQERIATLERKFQGVKLIVGVDRLDYIKGVPQKLHALEVFLTEHPEWVGKVVLVQVAVPSRQDVEEYQNLRAVVNELVGRINGKFGILYKLNVLLPDAYSANPVQVQLNSCPFTLCTNLSTSMNLLLCMQSLMSAWSPRPVMG